MRVAHLVSRCPGVLSLALLFAVGLPACDSLASFTGDWQGKVSADPNLQQGFLAGDALSLRIVALDSGIPEMSVQLPSQAGWLRFEPVRRATADALGALTLPGDPLRSYLGYVRPQGQLPLFSVISLFPPDHVEARLIQGPDDVYGVFRMTKQKPRN